MSKVSYFVRGVARVLDFKQSIRGEVLRKYDPTQRDYSPEKVDRDSIGSDWAIIGNDIRKVLHESEVQTASK